MALGLYLLVASITGSVVEYRNELYRIATPDPVVSKVSGALLSDAQLTEAAKQQYPEFRVERITHPVNPEQAVDVTLRRGSEVRKRLFDPHNGEDAGNAVARGVVLVSELLDLHDNLLAGETGRKVNAAGGIALVMLGLTGLVIWWPGISSWKRSLTLQRGLGWKRLNWQIHSAVGFWTLAFVVIFGLSGFYLGFPEQVQDFADWLQPPTPANAGNRMVDHALYWLAFLHFGRINGIGIPCKGPGVCDQATKAVWALVGLAPAAMFVTGAVMWWNRTVRPRMLAARKRSTSRAATTA